LVTEVVFVGEPLEAPQLELADQGSVGVGSEERAAIPMDAVLPAPDVEAVQVHVLPTERDLQNLVKAGDACVASQQQPAPDQRADARSTPRS